MKSSRRYTETALDEIKLLQHCREANPTHAGYEHVVTFVDSFMHLGVHDQHHVCMVSCLFMFLTCALFLSPLATYPTSEPFCPAVAMSVSGEIVFSP